MVELADSTSPAGNGPAKDDEYVFPVDAMVSLFLHLTRVQEFKMRRALTDIRATKLPHISVESSDPGGSGWK